MKHFYRLSTFWIIFAWPLIYFTSVNGTNRHEKRLLNDLLKDYDVNERPVANASDIVDVKLRLLFRQLLEIDEPTQSMKSLVWMKMTWKDVNLQWNASNYAGYSTIRVDPSRIWIPDLTLYNNVHEGGGDLYSFKTKIIVTSDGIVSWLSPTILESICILDISKFPFDKQECKLTIGSWIHDGLALDLNLEKEDDPDTNSYKKNTEWKLDSAYATKNTNVFDCCPTPYYDITYTFNIRRKHLYYIMTIILPCIVLSLLSTISFIFPADSGERLSLVISVLLGLVVFMLIVNDKTPVTSDTVPMITLYFNAIGLLIFLSLLATASVLRMNHSTESAPVSGCLKGFRDFVACLLCMPKIHPKKTLQLDFGELLLLTDGEHSFNLEGKLVGSATRKRSTDEKILKELQNLSKRFQEEDCANEVKEDWKYTGRVLDKFFFCFFLMAFIAISCYVLSFMI